MLTQFFRVLHFLRIFSTAAIAILFTRAILARWKLKKLLRSHGQGRTVVVTGAAGGVGSFATELFITKGWNVWAVDLNNDALKDLEKRIENANVDSASSEKGQLHCVAMDITDASARQNLFERVQESLKDNPDGLDCLVNNAGISKLSSIFDTPPAIRQKQFDVNFHSAVAITELFQKILVKGSRGGNMVNVGSIAGTVPCPYQGLYSPCKAALESFSVVLRREAIASKVNLKISVIRPGAIDTPLVKDQFNDVNLLSIDKTEKTPFSEGLHRVGSMVGESVDIKKFERLVIIQPDAVAEAVYACAIDDDPPTHMHVMTPLFGLFYHAARFMPTKLTDRLLDAMMN